MAILLPILGASTQYVDLKLQSADFLLDLSYYYLEMRFFKNAQAVCNAGLQFLEITDIQKKDLFYNLGYACYCVKAYAEAEKALEAYLDTPVDQNDETGEIEADAEEVRELLLECKTKNPSV